MRSKIHAYLPTIAIMERLLLITMNVGTWMLDLARHDYLRAWEALGS